MTKTRKTFLALFLAGALTVAGPAAAMAYKDSGVGTRASGSSWGKLQAYQRGSGNSWAPGDWRDGYTYSQWNGESVGYRWIYDSQNAGYGGGSWRVVASDTYSSLSTSCTSVG
jgi:hypothetical protein